MTASKSHVSLSLSTRVASAIQPTILDLTNPGLEVVEGQVADLILQVVEIHDCEGGCRR